jgi:hypothetical protein
LDPELPISNVNTVDEILDGALSGGTSSNQTRLVFVRMRAKKPDPSEPLVTSNRDARVLPRGNFGLA